ncbi:MAG: AAA family ATPase, partial [Nitrospinae bacterium]|nr:AAA family ATPase [Nitrospinota bacterium]
MQEQIYKGVRTNIYRAIRQSDQKDVTLKVLSEKYILKKDIERFSKEFEIGSKLHNKNIIQYLALESSPFGPVIVTEFFDGKRITESIPEKGLPLEHFLRIAIQLSDALEEIHAKKVIYKDFKPHNIIFEKKTNSLKLIDFCISTQIELEAHHETTINKLEGTIQYISPEQTGRMNRSLDYRTDFYSLGITLYELLCGSLPFKAKEPIEYIHFHLAKTPQTPSSLRPEIPVTVSNIIMKLIQKNAEDRYQSASALRSDLEECLRQWRKTGKIDSFEIARNDFSDKFLISEKLYGREGERKVLLEVFEKASRHKGEFLLITGYPGVGKSTLIQEILKPVTGKMGYFISGSFDQFSRGTAYSALSTAFESLIKYILSENQQKINEWKKKIINALGQNGQIIIDIIPSLELIIGKQQVVQELAPIESQNRFNMVFINFLKVFTRMESPVVLFIDDLQWADSASLQTIQLMAREMEIKYFLLIAACRDNEMDSYHPVSLMLNEIKSVRENVTTIKLSPLNKENTNKLISDALGCSQKKSSTLSDEIYRKTEGNPFFIKLFLRSLYDEKALNFSVHSGWEWDIKSTKKMLATENVIDLMLHKLNSFSSNTQRAVQFASCLRNVFDLSELSLILGQQNNVTLLDLKPLFDAGMLVQDDDSIRFVHERVREASYAMIHDDLKEMTHFEIGSLLWKNIPEEQIKSR